MSAERVDLTCLAAAAMCILLSLMLALRGGLEPHIVGWVLSSLLAFGAVARQRRLATDRRAEKHIGEAAWIPRAALVVVLAGMAVSAVHSWAIAWDIASRINS